MITDAKAILILVGYTSVVTYNSDIIEDFIGSVEPGKSMAPILPAESTQGSPGMITYTVGRKREGYEDMVGTSWMVILYQSRFSAIRRASHRLSSSKVAIGIVHGRLWFFKIMRSGVDTYDADPPSYEFGLA